LRALVRIEAAALSIGGVDTNELAAAYGTPLLALDTDVLDGAVARFAAVAARFDLDVCYAGKALLFVALARRIAPSPLGIDVCSFGELLTVERAGFPAHRIVLHGCGKTDDEIAAAAAGRVGRTVVDHRSELERLGAAASPAHPVSVLLRVNAGIEAHTHAHVRTGGEDSKFGFPAESIAEDIAFTLACPGLRLVGLHSHLGSQIFEIGPFVASVSVLVKAFAAALDAGAPVSQLVLGGGFGVEARPGAATFDLEGALESVVGAVERESRARNIATPRIGIEPGRSIVAESGTSLYRVVATKRHGPRRFAIVDGGIADNPRPALYGAYHHPVLAGRPSDAPPTDFTVCGRSCESDLLVRAPLPGDLRAGDLLALRTTGAYTYSMASNYNRFPKPAVAFAGAGHHRLVVRRERDEEILRYDVDEPAPSALVAKLY